MFNDYNDDDFTPVGYQPNTSTAARPGFIRNRSKDRPEPPKANDQFDLDVYLQPKSKPLGESSGRAINMDDLNLNSSISLGQKNAVQSKKGEIPSPQYKKVEIPSLDIETGTRRSNMRNPRDPSREKSRDHKKREETFASVTKPQEKQSGENAKQRYQQMKAQFQAQLKEERERHQQQLNRLQEYHQRERNALQQQFKESQEASKEHYQQLLKSQKQMFEEELQLLQGQLKRGGVKQQDDRSSGSGMQEMLKQLQNKQESNLQFLKLRIAAGQKKLENDREDLRQERHALLQREAALKEEIEQDKIAIMREMDRAAEAEKRVHAQTVQLQNQRTRTVEQIRKSREESRRDMERERMDLDSLKKELALEKELIVKEKKLLEVDRTEFESRRGRAFEEIDKLKGTLLIKEADYTAKLRGIESKEAENTRLGDQLKGKITILDLEKERYQSEIRRIQQLVGRQVPAATIAPEADYLKDRQNTMSRIVRLDDYFREAISEKNHRQVSSDQQDGLHFQKGSESIYIDDLPKAKKPAYDKRMHKKRATEIEKYIRRMSATKQSKKQTLRHPKFEEGPSKQAQPQHLVQSSQEGFSLLERFMRQAPDDKDP